MEQLNNQHPNKNRLTATELRVIGISLALLSLGLAIAWAGFVWFSSQKDESKATVTPTVENHK